MVLLVLLVDGLRVRFPSPGPKFMVVFTAEWVDVDVGVGVGAGCGAAEGLLVWEWERGRLVRAFCFKRAANVARFEVGFVVVVVVVVAPVKGLVVEPAFGVVDDRAGSRTSVGNVGVWLRAKGDKWYGLGW